jgi:hypothetical protein
VRLMVAIQPKVGRILGVRVSTNLYLGSPDTVVKKMSAKRGGETFEVGMYAMRHCVALHA